MLQFQKFIGKTTTSVVKTTVQIILDEGGSQVSNLAKSGMCNFGIIRYIL